MLLMTVNIRMIPIIYCVMLKEEKVNLFLVAVTS